MSKGQEVETIRNYVEGACQHYLSAHRDITRIEFRHRHSMHDSFIKLSTAFGTARFFDITDMDCNTICILIGVIVSGNKPNVELADLEVIREVEALFSK